jgi:hypothetical protein
MIGTAPLWGTHIYYVNIKLMKHFSVRFEAQLMRGLFFYFLYCLKREKFWGECDIPKIDKERKQPPRIPQPIPWVPRGRHPKSIFPRPPSARWCLPDLHHWGTWCHGEVWIHAPVPWSHALGWMSAGKMGALCRRHCATELRILVWLGYLELFGFLAIINMQEGKTVPWFYWSKSCLQTQCLNVKWECFLSILIKLKEYIPPL